MALPKCLSDVEEECLRRLVKVKEVEEEDADVLVDLAPTPFVLLALLFG